MASLAQRYLQRIPQYTRNARHLRAVLQHGTPRKLANLARVEAERRLRRVTVSGHPYILIIDPTNFCNLRCPLCPTGAQRLGREQSMMSLDCFRRWFDPHAPWLFEAYLHNWGESLLNKATFDMIAYAQSRNVGTNLSSNLSIASEEDLDRLIEAGLEYLVVSLDGTTAESYAKYRVRGDFERVVHNMATLISRRNARGRRTPVVEWQYIVMKHNEHEVDEAEAIAKRIGVDVMRFIPVGLPYDFEDRRALREEWFPTRFAGRVAGGPDEQTFGQGSKPGPCFYLYRSMVVNSDGGVSPCCVVYQKDRDFADLAKAEGPIDVMEIYNNPSYRSARSLFSAEAMPDRPRTVCDGCDIFAMHPAKIHPGKTCASALATPAPSSAPATSPAAARSDAG